MNIVSATVATGRDRIATLRFTFELADISHLAHVLSSVKRVDGVYDAFRVLPHGNDREGAPEWGTGGPSRTCSTGRGDTLQGSR